jgi:hypothetical protein
MISGQASGARVEAFSLIGYLWPASIAVVGGAGGGGDALQYTGYAGRQPAAFVGLDLLLQGFDDAGEVVYFMYPPVGEGGLRGIR